jgi:Flp pilus assembly protein TadG
MRHTGHFARNERGAAIIELAVSAPLLIIMVFAVLQFSIVLHNKVVLAESVGFAARTLAMQRGVADPCSTTVTKLKAALGTAMASTAQITLTVHGTTYGPSNNPSCSGSVGTSMTSGEDATLKATYPWSIGVYGISLGPGTLTSQVTVRVE